MRTDSLVRGLTHPSEYGEIAFSPDGKVGYGSAQTNRWLRWDLATGKEIDSVENFTVPPEAIAFSPDGKYVAVYGSVWDRATGKRLHLLPIASRGILLFTADSKSIVYEATVLRWIRLQAPEEAVGGLHMMDLAAGKKSTRELEDFVGNMSLYYCGLTLSPDGKTMAGPFRLWDFASGKLIGKLEHDDVQWRTTMFAFSPDSKKLAYFAPRTAFRSGASPTRKWSAIGRLASSATRGSPSSAVATLLLAATCRTGRRGRE